MGHSWGTVLGLQAAARAPERYKAYVAEAQIVRQLDSEKLAYRYMLEKYRAAGDSKMVRALEQIPLPDLDAMPQAYRALRDEAMHGLGVGTTHEMRSVVTGLFFPSLMSPVYTLPEKVALWRGKWSDGSTEIWNRLLSLDLGARVPKLDLPVYFLHGTFDYTVAYPLTKEYVEKLEAPSKGFYTFPRSAHSPLYEEPELARQILREDVLSGAHALADVVGTGDP
jgi:pimeloyl-ACP methyl ester carboxylesterase